MVSYLKVKYLSTFHYGTFTGKPTDFGGSYIRKEATGYGLVYFLLEMLKYNNDTLVGKRIIISGSGNVSLHTAKKITDLGGIIVGISDTSGYVYDPNGVNLGLIIFYKSNNKSLLDYANSTKDECLSSKFFSGSIFNIQEKIDIALPCATQNEISLILAQNLSKQGVKYVAEGSNMATNKDAMDYFYKNDIFYAPGSVSNSGGVITSYFEMLQNEEMNRWSKEIVNQKLESKMKEIFSNLLNQNRPKTQLNLHKEAMIFAFKRLTR